MAQIKINSMRKNPFETQQKLMMRIFIVFVLFLGFTSCRTSSVQQVNSDIKTKFGFEITTPNKAVFFVENKKSKDRVSDLHSEIADLLYQQFGPATDDFFIAKTNARDFKFNLADKTYYIDVEKLPKNTAMILFDGKHKPIIEYNPKNYRKLIEKIK